MTTGRINQVLSEDQAKTPDQLAIETRSIMLNSTTAKLPSKVLTLHPDETKRIHLASRYSNNLNRVTIPFIFVASVYFKQKHNRCEDRIRQAYEYKLSRCTAEKISAESFRRTLSLSHRRAGSCRSNRLPSTLHKL